MTKGDDQFERGFGLHWFRRDLRVVGNAAFAEARTRHAGNVFGLFIVDHAFSARRDFSPNRFGFLLATLRALRKDLLDIGSELLVLSGPPAHVFPELLHSLAELGRMPDTVSFCREYDENARRRDAQIERQLGRAGIRALVQRDHLLIEPHELLKKATNDPYVVFTPFARRWRELLQEDAIRARVAEPPMILARPPVGRRQWGDGHAGPTRDEVRALWRRLDRLETLTHDQSTRATVPMPPAGHAAAVSCLHNFGRRLEGYGAARDFPADNGSSGLSVYLNNGTISSAQVIHLLGLHERPQPGGPSGEKFLSELIWREFYHHVLFHFPLLGRTALNPAYRTIRWRKASRAFAAWKAGQTGFPIVDAGMRQLAATGWIHNRVRMIVASFLAKDLQVDWRLGARWFMQTLLDGDRAANYGGWQWAASTGCDAQPYFRVFNPWIQSRRFDPAGAYIRRFVPELAGCDAAALHHPQAARPGYPRPIVDHAMQRLHSIALYRNAARLARTGAKDGPPSADWSASFSA